MIPSRSQYNKWSTPSKWTFWAGIIGIPVGVISLIFSIINILPNEEYRNLVLQAAQELRYNKEWLSDISIAVDNKSSIIPVGKMKTDALVKLTNLEYLNIVAESYGEEKYIYQEILKLHDLANTLGSPGSIKDVDIFNERSKYKLHDVAFLNSFLNWYLRPLIEENLDDKQLYSLGWNPFPVKYFSIEGISELDMNYFIYEGKPITEYLHYLALID
ncbi:hypothetical protein BMS3Abin11_00089 [bacterium BMS3Abin11]|nr:hypothetical protein BMS3Abin11_00089 [bacterium BMS3Abin11]